MYRLEPPEQPFHELGIILNIQPSVIKHGNASQHRQLPTCLTLPQRTCKSNLVMLETCCGY